MIKKFENLIGRVISRIPLSLTDKNFFSDSTKNSSSIHLDLKFKPSRYVCSFCGKNYSEVKNLIASKKGVYICNECVNGCNESFQNLIKENVNKALQEDSEISTSEKIVTIPFANADLQDCKCSFCGKTDKQVKGLIAGNNVYICDECIKICNKILDKKSDVDDLKPKI